MADHADHEYVHGTMNIDEQRNTFALFWTLTKWGSVLIGILMIVLAVTRTNAVNCSKSDASKQYINACGKLARSGEGNAPQPPAEH